MKFKQKNLDIGDFVLLTEGYDEFGDRLKNPKRHIGIIHELIETNGTKAIVIVKKDTQKYNDKINSFKDFLTKSFRIIYENNYGFFSQDLFSEENVSKINKLKIIK